MGAILVLMQLLFAFAGAIVVMFMAGVGVVLWEVAKQMTKNMKDDEMYDS